jgi:hypothetical protein
MPLGRKQIRFRGSTDLVLLLAPPRQYIHLGNMAGLPPKPYVPPTAPAPPLPAGPAPAQPAYNAQDPAAAHAAAWAAYYQVRPATWLFWL